MKLSQIMEVSRGSSYPPTMEEKREMIRRFQERFSLESGNIYQELEMSSPYVDAHRDTSSSNDYVTLHSHTFYELIFCQNTCGVEYFVGTERFKLQKGDIIYVAPGVSHRPILPYGSTELYRRDVVWINENFIRKIAGELDYEEVLTRKHSGLFRTAGTEWEMIGGYFHNCVRESEGRKNGWQASVLGNAFLILSALIRASQETPIKMKAEKPELLDRIMYYIEENLTKKITLKDTAEHFFVSSSTISNLFRSKLGVSFYHCVTQRRLIASKDLIQKDIPLERVAEMVGFNDYSAFYRAFKQEYGISPREFRTI